TGPCVSKVDIMSDEDRPKPVPWPNTIQVLDIDAESRVGTNNAAELARPIIQAILSPTDPRDTLGRLIAERRNKGDKLRKIADDINTDGRGGLPEGREIGAEAMLAAGLGRGLYTSHEVQDNLSLELRGKLPSLPQPVRFLDNSLFAFPMMHRSGFRG